ncbi:MAG TPA: hypothetical protein VHW01_05215 [Polyangiaceae bacterium]|jgi:hypothetical protein|nr:hypothetical protein [Polyangiaceae bacterium]
MSEQDQAQRPKTTSEAEQTLLGVAPPRIDTAVDSGQRSPVYVRSGTSLPDVDSVPPPRMTMSSRPPPLPGAVSETSPPPPATKSDVGVAAGSRFAPALRYARARPILGMVLVPVLFSVSLIAVAGHRSAYGRVATNRSALPNQATASASAAAPPPKVDAVAELESRPASSLSSRELVLLAEAHTQQKRAAAELLREKLEQNPALGKDSALQSQLLHLAEDPTTAADALSAMAQIESPSGTDLLYEVWTGTTVRTDTTELARALLYSADMRPKASSALGVALDLRAAETCPQYQAILPKALTDGDRRALHLLAKLNAKRGCGPKKTDDCFACLRDKSDELTATINAVKSRRPPSFTNQ